MYLAVAVRSKFFFSILVKVNVGFSLSFTKFSIASVRLLVDSSTLLWVASLSLMIVFADANVFSKSFHVWVVYSSLRLLFAELITFCKAVLSTARAFIASSKALVASSISLCFGSGDVWSLTSLAFNSAFWKLPQDSLL